MQTLKESCYKKEQYMRIPTETAKVLYFYVQWAGKLECKPNFYIRRNLLDSYLLLYTTAGSGTLHYENSTYKIEKGSVVLLNCKIDQEYFTEQAPWTFQYIHFRGNLSDRYCRLIQTLYQSPVFTCHSPNLGSLFDRIISGTAALRDEVLVSDALYHLLATFIARADDRQPGFPASKIMDYIADHYMEPLDVKAIANTFGFSRSYFTTQFKSTTDRTPYDYLMQCRISAAKQMLIHSTFSIARIADACGFTCSSAFIRSFKTQTGLSPLAYKKKVLSGELPL